MAAESRNVTRKDDSTSPRLVNVRIVLSEHVKGLTWPSWPAQVLVGPGIFVERR
mgnify:CR=1 FL=1